MKFTKLTDSMPGSDGYLSDVMPGSNHKPIGDSRNTGIAVSIPTGNGESWFTGTLVGFDTETNGVDTASARIVSAALITDIPEDEPIILEWLLNPGVDIPLEATAIHGISTEHAERYGVDSEKGIADMVDALSKVTSPLVVVNGAFDFSLIVNEAARYSIDATPVIENLRIIDTLVMDRFLDPFRPGRRTLTAVAASYGIAIRGAHQATGDVICAIRLARAMGLKYPTFGSADLSALQKVQADAYQEQVLGLRDFRRMDEPDFEVSTAWPYQTQIPL